MAVNSTRRGFLGLIGGGAVAGPEVLKGAMAKAKGSPETGHMTGVSLSDSSNNTEWAAKDILRLMEPARAPSMRGMDYSTYADIDALKSVSTSHKCRMNSEKQREQNLSHELRSFIKAKGLNLVGLDEKSLLSIIKKAAGE